MGSAKVKEFANHDGAACYGMCAAGLAGIKTNYPKVDGWSGARLLSEVTSNKATNSKSNGITADELIKYAHVTQMLPHILNTDTENAGELGILYSRLISESRQGSALVIRLVPVGFFSGNVKENHVHIISALNVVEETDTTVKILCYDPNYEKEDRFLYLYRTGKNGVFESWEYDGGWRSQKYTGKAGAKNAKSGGSNALITFITDAAEFFEKENEKLKNYESFEDYVLIHLHTTRKELSKEQKDRIAKLMDDDRIDALFPGNGTTTNQDYYFWTKKTELAFENIPSDFELTMASDNHSVNVCVTKKSDISIAVNKSKNASAAIKSDNGGEAVVTFFDSSNNSNVVESKTIGLKVEKGKTASIKQTSSELEISGASSFTITKQEGKEKSDGTITYDKPEKLSENKINSKETYRITASAGKKLELTAAGKLKKGAKKTVGKLKYKVTSVSVNAGTVTITGTTMKKSKFKKLSIPATVKIEGAAFKVTAIGNKAFTKCKKLKSVTIGKNVKTIGTSAFAGDTALTKVTIGKSVTKIGKAAFSGDKKLKTITIKSSKLKSVGKNAIKGIQKKAVIKVPKKQLKKYKKLFKSKTGFKKTMKIKK